MCGKMRFDKHNISSLQVIFMFVFLPFTVVETVKGFFLSLRSIVGTKDYKKVTDR